MTFLTDQVIAYVTFVLPIWVPLLIVDVLALVVMIFVERLDPRSLIFWITMVVILPFAGVVLFLLYGSTLYADWRYQRKSEADRRFLDGEQDLPEGEDGIVAGSMHELGADVCSSGNRVRFYWGRSDFVSDLVDDIGAAVE